jgi:Bacterial Ig-like domain
VIRDSGFGARAALVGTMVVALLAPAGAQTTRRATNIGEILGFPSFYHLRPIVVVGTLAQQPNGELRLSDDSGSLRVIPKGNAPDGLDEVRGEFWDVGRMKSDDPRLAVYDLRATFHIDPDTAWPRPGEVTALIATTIEPAPSLPGPPSTSIRAVVLNPSRYLDQKVTLVGQFEGRNLAGDLPDAPARSRYDFVLRSGDAAIWVSNLRPKGKDARGRDFELGLDARIDTGRWLQVSGTVRTGRGLLWVEGDAGSFSIATAPSETPADERDVVRVPAGPAPEVIFSTPTEEETDVSLTTSIRIQFSRDIDPASLKGHVRVAYVEPPPVDPAAATVAFTSSYAGANRVVEVQFAKPLEPFRTVQVTLDGLLGTDQQPAKPWTLTFALGGP